MNCVMETKGSIVVKSYGSLRIPSEKLLQLAESNFSGLYHGSGFSINVERIPNGDSEFVVFTDLSEYLQKIDELSITSLTDDLTSIPTRRSFISFLEKTLKDVEQGTLSVALIYIDLDNFKKYNDLYGHPFGDEILKIAAIRFKSCLRNHDYVARVGGDEFVVVVNVSNTESPSQVVKSVVNRIFTSFTKPIWIEGKEANIFCSAGIYIAEPFDKITTDEIVRCADSAMLVAKGKGRSNFQFYDVERAVSSKDSQECLGLVVITDKLFTRKVDNLSVLKSTIYLKSKNGIYPAEHYPILKKDIDVEFCSKGCFESLVEQSENYIFIDDISQISFFLSIGHKMVSNYRIAISDDIIFSKPDGLDNLVKIFPNYALLVSGKAPIGVTLDNLQHVNTVFVSYDNCLKEYGEYIDQIVFSIAQIATVTKLKLIVDISEESISNTFDSCDYILLKG